MCKLSAVKQEHTRGSKHRSKNVFPHICVEWDVFLLEMQCFNLPKTLGSGIAKFN